MLHRVQNDVGKPNFRGVLNKQFCINLYMLSMLTQSSLAKAKAKAAVVRGQSYVSTSVSSVNSCRFQDSMLTSILQSQQQNSKLQCIRHANRDI